MCKRTMFFGLILGLLLAGAALTPSALSDPPAVFDIDKPAAKSLTLAGVEPSDKKVSPSRLVLQGKTDSKLKELLKERLATLRELVKATEGGYLTGKVSFDRLHQAQRALLHAELELCDSDKERITVLEKVVALAKEYEKNADTRFQTGNTTQSDVLLARVGRLEAEIALERAKAKVPAQSK